MLTKSETRFRRLTDTDDLRTGLGVRSVRAGLLTAIFSFGDLALRIGSTAILARLVSPEYFGLVMMATAVTAIADQFRDLGLSSATIQQKDITHAEVSNLFWINVALGTCFALIVCAVSPVTARYFGDPRLPLITCVLSICLLFGGLTVQHEALLTRCLQTGQVAAIRLVANTISTGVAIALALWGGGYWSLIWREVIRAALVCLGVWGAKPWLPGLPCRQTSVQRLVKFGAHLTSANIFGTAVGVLDRFLLGRYCDAASVAIYRQAYQLVSSPTDQLVNPIYQVTQPSLSMLQREPTTYVRFYSHVVSVVALLTMPLSLFVALYSKPITTLLLGPQWAASAPILLILSLSAFAKQAIGASAQVPITLGRGSTYFYLTAIQNIAIICGLAIGIRWQTTGVALGFVAATYLTTAPRLYLSLEYSPVSCRAHLSALIRPLASSLGMGALLLLLQQAQLSRSAAIELIIAAVAAVPGFLITWVLLPGGLAELLNFTRTGRSALQRRGGSQPLLASVR